MGKASWRDRDRDRGSDDKVRLALEHGYDHVVNYRTENFVERVAEITGGAKCDVVYDPSARDTYPQASTA